MSNVQLDALEGLVCSATRELLEPLEVAILLGAEISAPAGTHFFELFHNSPKQGKLNQNGVIEKVRLGFYPTYEEAEIALANWIIKDWHSHEIYPWGEGCDESDDRMAKVIASEDREKTYLELYSYPEVIVYYFDLFALDSYIIEKRTVTRAISQATGNVKNNS